ncbi:MAG: hypothetical protein AAGJ83_14645, partial [Planctomycetota bacterium]
VAEYEDDTISLLTIDPIEGLLESRANVDDLLRPGIYEWAMLKADGGSQIVPDVAVIDLGEGDLSRLDANQIRQAFLPIEVDFLSSEDWVQQNSFAGSSSIGLMLLALLGLLLAAEQALAYWASYHTGMPTAAHATAVRGRRAAPSFGLGAKPRGGRANDE